MHANTHTYMLLISERPAENLITMVLLVIEPYGERQDLGGLQLWKVYYWKMEDMPCHPIRKTTLAGCSNFTLPAGVAMAQEESLRDSREHKA